MEIVTCGRVGEPTSAAEGCADVKWCCGDDALTFVGVGFVGLDAWGRDDVLPGEVVACYGVEGCNGVCGSASGAGSGDVEVGGKGELEMDARRFHVVGRGMIRADTRLCRDLVLKHTSSVGATVGGGTECGQSRHGMCCMR